MFKLRRLKRSVRHLLLILLISVFSISLISLVNAITPTLPNTDQIADIKHLEQLLKQAQAQGDRGLAAKINSNLGIIYKNIGQYDRAIDFQKTAGRLFFDLKARRPLGQTLINLGNAHAAIGDYEKAKTAYEQSLKIAVAAADRHGQAVALNSLGGVAANHGHDPAAIKYFESALKIQTQLGDRETEAYILLNLGSSYHVLKQFDAAIQHSQAAKTIAQAIANPTLEAQALTNLALTADAQKDYAKALQEHRQAIAIAKTIGNPNLLAQLLNNYSYTLFQSGDLTMAETTIRQSIQQLEALRSQHQADAYKVSLFDTKRFSYALLQQILVTRQQPEAALEVAEQGRARAFAELLTPAPTSAKPALETITLDQIRQFAITQKATIVEYSLISDRSFQFRGKQQGKAETLMIWVVQPDGAITLRQVDLRSRWATQGDLKQIVRAARCLQPYPTCPTLGPTLASAPSDKPARSIHSLLNYPSLAELHAILIDPIADRLPANPDAPVIFVPQDSLFLVPFAALPDAQGEPLIKRHTISTAPSIQVLALTQKRPDRRPDQRPHPTLWQPQQIVIAGNPDPMPIDLAPLPYAQAEAIKISQLFHTQPLLGKQATRSQLLAKFPQARLIHLATHGLLEYGQADSLDLPGAIALAATDQDAGLLTAQAIAKLKLKADLVVLSACDTGRGTLSGDGVLGLARAWMTAGATNVLVSLWAVNDESTSTLMVQFYKALLTQPNAAIALRQAMLETMEKYPNPYDWSAFTLIGG